MKNFITTNKLVAAAITVAIIGGATFGLGSSNQPTNAAYTNSPATEPTANQSSSDASRQVASQEAPQAQASKPSPTTSTTGSVTFEPSPIVVSAVQEIVLDSNNSDCQYTYSDGTTYQWHWKVLNPQGQWSEDGAGQNGHWVASTTSTGTCDPVVIGEPK